MASLVNKVDESSFSQVFSATSVLQQTKRLKTFSFPAKTLLLQRKARKKMKSTASSWLPPTVALVHIAANLRGFFVNNLQQNDDAWFVTVGLVLQGDNAWFVTVGLVFLLALFNAGITYRGAAYFSILVHTLAVVRNWDNTLFDIDILLVVLALREQVFWMFLASLVLVCLPSHLNEHGLPRNAILCFYMEKPEKTETEPFWKQFVDQKNKNPEIHEELNPECGKTDQVWVRAGYQLDSPQRLVVRKEPSAAREKIEQRAVTPTNTPTITPPVTPDRIVTTRTVKPPEEKLPLKQTAITVRGQQQEEEASPLAPEETKSTGTSDNPVSLCPTIREARGLINEMLAKSTTARGKEKVS